MVAEKDVLDNEVSASVALSENSVEVKLKSRTTSALDRLCGNAIDYINLKIERPVSRDRALIDAERAVIDAAGKSAVASIESDPEYAKRIIESHLKGIARKQRNKEAIGKIAFDEINRLPPPDAASIENSPDEIDEDWLNRFESLAEAASTERMQQLFGKILSGEIRKPGAFSLTTLRVASELSQKTAQLFQELAGVRMSDAIVEFDAEADFGKFLDLEVAGLVNFDSGSLARKIASVDGKTGNLVGDGIIAICEMKNPAEIIHIKMVRLTPVGYELAALIPNNELRAIRGIIENHKSQIISAALHVIAGKKDGRLLIKTDPIETIQNAK